MKTRVQLILIFVLAFFVLSLIFSQKANPDASLIFGLKRIQEKAFLNLKSSPVEKIDYMSALLDNRLAELSNVVKNKNYNYVLPSSSRYSTLAGQITDLVVTNNLKDLAAKIKIQFENHRKILYGLYVFYPKNLPDNVEWKYVQDDYNYLKIYLDKLSQI